MTPEYTLLNNNTDVERKEDGDQIVSGVKGHKRKRPVNDQEDKPKKIKDPSIVQLGVSSVFTNTQENKYQLLIEEQSNSLADKQ